MLNNDLHHFLDGMDIGHGEVSWQPDATLPVAVDNVADELPMHATFDHMLEHPVSGPDDPGTFIPGNWKEQLNDTAEFQFMDTQSINSDLSQISATLASRLQAKSVRGNMRDSSWHQEANQLGTHVSAHEQQSLGAENNSGIESNLSDCSWTSDDGNEDWYSDLSRQIRGFRVGRGMTFTTGPLESRQRRQVHSMANLWGLSHITIGTRDRKRILVSKCALLERRENRLWKDSRCNPAVGNWAKGYIDPSILVIENISLMIHLDTCLRVLRIPIPTEKLSEDHQHHRTIIALFKSPNDAGVAINALHDSRPDWNEGVPWPVKCTHLYLGANSLASGQICHGESSLVGTYNISFDRISLASPSQPFTTLRQSEELIEHYPVVYQEQTQSPRDGHLSQFPDDATWGAWREQQACGYSSTTSLADSDFSTTSSISKKRKREPMIPRGYQCSNEDCGRFFDFAGERNKHEQSHRNHKPYTCDHCAKAFRYPKDLRRHLKNVHNAGEDELLGRSQTVRRADSSIPHRLSIPPVPLEPACSESRTGGPATAVPFLMSKGTAEANGQD